VQTDPDTEQPAPEQVPHEAVEGDAPPHGNLDWRQWLNPATVRGALLIVAGLAILITPDVSVVVLRLAVGGGLLVNGVLTLWHHIRGEETSRSSLFGAPEALLAIIAGTFLIVFPSATVGVFALIIGGYLTVKGVLAIVGGFRKRSRRPVVDFVRGGAMIAVAIFAVALPETLIDGVIIACAAAAIALGGLYVASGVRAAAAGLPGDVDAATLTHIVAEWVNTWDIGAVRREEIGEGLFFENPDRTAKLVAWWVMLLLSVVIATFAVLQDSTAVVIGAMLVAPLMTPILGASAAIVNGEQQRLASDMLLVMLGVLASIGLAFIIATWAPAVVPLDANSQVTSRINPNVIDMGIALAAGAAGAFATVNKRVASSIAGVAIAVALVPPLAVVGVTLQAARYDEASGAFLLFTTNLVAILLAAVAVLIATGYTSARRIQDNRKQMVTTLTLVGGMAIIILVPLAFSAEGAISDQLRQSNAQQVATDWVGDDEDLVLNSVTVEGNEVKVQVSGSDRLPSVEELGQNMSEALGPNTRVVVQFTPTTVTTYRPDGTVTTRARPEPEE